MMVRNFKKKIKICFLNLLIPFIASKESTSDTARVDPPKKLVPVNQKLHFKGQEPETHF